MRKNKIDFDEKSEYKELSYLIMKNKLVEGRLDSWFPAFAAFGHKSAHENYPTKEQVELDPIIRNRTDLTILIGKQLVAELLNALTA